jgi:hypothetical protein
MNGRSRNQNLIYIFAIIGVLVAVYIVYQFLTAGLQAYIALIAGVLLVLANGPDLVRSLQQRQLGVAMHNTMVGLALISYFIGRLVLSVVFWPLAILLLFAAIPLVLDRVGMAQAYLRIGRNLANQARQLFRMRQRMY